MTSWCLAMQVQNMVQYARYRLTSPEWRWIGTCLELLAMPVLTQIEIPQAFTTTKVHCWLMFNMLSSRILQPFSEDCSLPSQSLTFTIPLGYSSSAAGLSVCLGWPSWILSVLSSSSLKWLWMASVFLTYHQLPQFDVIHKLFEVPFCDIIKAIDEACITPKEH